MSSSIVLKVATVTSTVTFAKTDAEVAQVLRWFLADKAEPVPDGLTQAQANQWYLDYATAEIVRYVRREAIKNRLRELKEQQSVEEQAVSDTAI